MFPFPTGLSHSLHPLPVPRVNTQYLLPVRLFFAHCLLSYLIPWGLGVGGRVGGRRRTPPLPLPTTPHLLPSPPLSKPSPTFSPSHCRRQMEDEMEGLKRYKEALAGYSECLDQLDTSDDEYVPLCIFYFCLLSIWTCFRFHLHIFSLYPLLYLHVLIFLHLLLYPYLHLHTLSLQHTISISSSLSLLVVLSYLQYVCMP